MKPQGRQALGEAPVAMRAQLHQQEPGTAAQGTRRNGGICGHLRDDTAREELFLI
jgi:hypothetical protein